MASLCRVMSGGVRVLGRSAALSIPASSSSSSSSIANAAVSMRHYHHYHHPNNASSWSGLPAATTTATATATATLASSWRSLCVAFARSSSSSTASLQRKPSSSSSSSSSSPLLQSTCSPRNGVVVLNAAKLHSSAASISSCGEPPPPSSSLPGQELVGQELVGLELLQWTNKTRLASSLTTGSVRSFSTSCTNPISSSTCNAQATPTPRTTRSFSTYTTISTVASSSSSSNPNKSSASTSSSSNRTTSKDWKDLVLLVFAAASAAALLLSARREAKLDQLRLQEQQTFADQEDVPIGSQELTLPELIGHARKPRTFFGKLYDTLLECILIPLRIFELAFRFAPVVFLAPLVFLPSRYYVAGWQQWWWTLLVHTIESCGPTFIKLAQWASSRRDLFPADMCAQLSRLHGRSQPHSFARTAEVIRSALAERNATVEDAFSYIDPQPVGSGCVAQVHRAILKADGSVVALKVLHPGIQRKIERDMLILYACAVTMETLVPPLRWMSLVESVEQFSSLMLRQLDLRIEGANLIKFNRNFANYRGIRFPTVFPEWTSERMLVESYEPGVSLNRFIRANDHPANLHLGELGLRAFLKMMILDNFIHGDLHPGNMLAQMQFPASQLSPEALASSRSLHNVPFNDDTLDTVPQHLHVNVQSATQYAETAEIIEEENPIGVLNDDDPLCFTFSLRPGAKHAYQPYQETYPNGKPTKPKDVQMLLIDAGIVTELSPVDRVNFIDLFTAVARGQGRAVGELMVDRARGQSENLDREGFISSVDNLVTRVRVQTLALGKVRIADILSEMFSLVCMYGVKLESNFVSLAVCIMVLEGIGRCLNPEIDLLDAALPMLEAVEANRGLTAGQLSNTQAGAIRNMARAFSGVRWVVFKGDIELLGQPSIVFHLMD